MKSLERDVGRSLFRRINNSLYPTEAARVLMRGADPLLMAEPFARRWWGHRHLRMGIGSSRG